MDYFAWSRNDLVNRDNVDWDSVIFHLAHQPCKGTLSLDNYLDTDMSVGMSIAVDRRDFHDWIHPLCIWRPRSRDRGRDVRAAD